MKKFQKVLSASVATAMIFTLAACGGNKADNNAATKTPAEGAKPGEKVTIVFAQGKDPTDGTKRMIDAFEAKNPNIHVELRELPNNSTQIHDQYVTILSAKSSEIDVMNIDVVWPAEFAQAGFLLPLDRFIKDSNLDLDKYLKAGVESGNFNGQQWTLPRYNNAGLLYYRKDLVKDVPKTWDDLIKQAKALKGQGGTQFGYLMQAKQYEGLVVNFVEFMGAYGGKILDDKGNVVINSPQSVQGLKKMMEVAQSDFVPSDVKTFTENETINVFLEGLSPFARHWPAMYAQGQDKNKSKIVDKFAVAPLPAGPAGSAAALGGWSAGINKNSKHAKEAWEFLKFISGPEGQKITAVYATNAPTYMPLYEDEEVKKASTLFANKDFVEGLSKAVPRPITPKYPEVSDIIQVEVSKAISGQQTAEQAIQAMDQKLKQVVSK